MFQSVVHLLLESIRKFPEKNVFLFKEKGIYQGVTYQEAGERVKLLSHGLTETGLTEGDRIAILSYNRPEWPICDFAIFAMRGISVPIYHTLPPSQIQYILNDAGVKAIFVENQQQWDKIKEILPACPTLEFIFTFSDVTAGGSSVCPINELYDRGARHLAQHPKYFQKSIQAIELERVCSIVYTSGTTGHPKGVMLHHKGFVIDIINSEAIFGIYPEDVFISFLPLSHLYERLGGHWCPLYKGATIGYAEDLTTVINDIQQVRPTVMVSVPRLYEKISNTVMDQVESGSPFKKKIFYWALKNGRHYQQLKRENRLHKWASLKNRIADGLVFSKVKQKLGGRFRFPISGGAPLSTETLKFFEAMGLQIVEGYGMTETHLIIALTPPGSTKYGSCGKPIPQVEVKIAQDGEILVKGETVMAGYFQQPDLTREMIDGEGWLHTGDIGFLDQDEYLFITDRKKNILVTAGGKNIAPAPIEHALKLSRYIEDACVIGDRRQFISAIIIPNFENLERWAKENAPDTRERHELVNLSSVQQLFTREIESLQSEMARYERVKKFLLLSEPLTIENGEMTPSLKIRRTAVEERFKDQIDRLYIESDTK